MDAFSKHLAPAIGQAAQKVRLAGAVA